VVLPLSALTEKDRRDLQFGLDIGVDWIALSFVQRPQDVAEARRLIAGRACVLSKLEKPAAIQCLEELVELSDAIMVARGDLGVEMPPEQVPCIQKRIVKACRRAGKPVVVATQMLDSMVHAPTPTRAEASDVATAIYDGADAVMLSAESAAGDYPVESVEMMGKIIRQVEGDNFYRSVLGATESETDSTSADAISEAAARVANQIRAQAIVTYTLSGSTALRIAQRRPSVPILSITPSPATARRLVLAWGIHSIMGEDAKDFEDMVTKAGRYAKAEEIAVSGDALVVTAGHPFGTPGATNVLRVMRVS
jgi:pyruvate kinase